MKKICSILAIIAMTGTLHAQDTTLRKKEKMPPPSRDSLPPSSDTSKTHKWNKMPKDKPKKNWPDSMGRMDTLRRD